MNRPKWVHKFIQIGLLLVTSICTATQAQKPNILFVLVDDLGWADLACYGNTLHETPTLDRLAAEGMRFTQCYTPCAVCSPTRAGIQTGQYPIRMNITDWIPGARKKNQLLEEKYTARQMPLEEFTIAEAVKKGGYQTWFLGKWHLGETEEYWPEFQGYDINLGGHSKGSPPGGYFAPYTNPRLTSGPDGEYLTDRLGNEAVKLIEQYSQSSDQPFFMMMAFYTVHTPIQPRPDLEQYYEQKLKDHPDSRWKRADYAAMVHCMDLNVGKILDALKKQDLENDTIVFFTSDNGGLTKNNITHNHPLRSGKGYYYEGGIRVPLIIRQPGMAKAGTECHWPVISNDFYPTILKMANLDPMPDQHKDGLDLTPLLKGAPALPRDTLYWHYPHYHGAGETPCSTIRSGDYKFIRHYEDGRRELYNLKEDIGEKHNLIDRQADQAQQLEQKLDQWLTQMNAYIPKPKKPSSKK